EPCDRPAHRLPGRAKVTAGKNGCAYRAGVARVISEPAKTQPPWLQRARVSHRRGEPGTWPRTGQPPAPAGQLRPLERRETKIPQQRGRCRVSSIDQQKRRFGRG